VLWFRLRHRRPLFRPDNSHIHHQLMAQGLSQRQTLVILILTDLSFLLLNLGLAGFQGIIWIVLADILWAVLLFGLMNRGPRNRRAV
ncbi:hypothetical protein LJB87_02905, partial [Alistipes sp. OttesenSCG-928-L06]|nr:hypothetical protein [Alistipes sp. OttesenSCG-928-L06]